MFKKYIMNNFIRINIKKVYIFIFFIIFFEFIVFPLPTLAYEGRNNLLVDNSGIDVQAQIQAVDDNYAKRIEELQSEIKAMNEQYKVPVEVNNIELPVTGSRKAKAIKVKELTAYSSDVSQCDASPCITANGFNVCKHGKEDTVAANFLPFGAKIRIPELYGDQVFIVRDRMNSKYQNRIDIWMTNREKAIGFGFKVAKIEILE